MKGIDQQLDKIAAECRRFSRREIAPYAADLDLAPDPARWADIWEKSGQLDLPGLLLPESCGGVGHLELAAAVVIDSLAGSCAGVASIFAHHFTACRTLLDHPNLPAAACDHIAPDRPQPPLAAWVELTESPEEGPVITRHGDFLELNGTAGLTANLEYADYLTVFARAAANPDNLLMVLVPAGTNGLSRGEKAHLPGLKINPLRPVRFARAAVPLDLLIAEGARATELLGQAQNTHWGLIAALATGCARTAWEEALNYARQRYQFGDFIIHHREIQRLLGEMRQQLEIGTAALSHLFQGGQNRLAGASAPIEASLVKSQCTGAALAIAQNAIQILGGYGYMQEYGLEKIMRDAKVLQLLGGRNPALQIAAISR